jgi:hypothetical protein
MSDRRLVDIIVSELGAATGLEDFALDDDGTATLEFDGSEVCLAGDSEGESITLFAPVKAGDDASTLRRALSANFLWRETSGATFALEPSSGRLALQLRLPLVGVDYPRFAAILEEFLDRVNWADSWNVEETSTSAEFEAASHDMRFRI